MPRGNTNPAIPHLAVVQSDAVAPSVASPPSEHEPEWLARASTGDLDAWSCLYHEHFDAVFAHVCYLVGDSILAEDLVQDVFARAMAHIATFDGRSTFLAWIRGIALNLVRMHWRRSSTSARIHRDVQAMAAVTEGNAELDRALVQEQRMRMLYAVLESVPESLREAFILRELEGISPQQAAQQLGITQGNLAVRLTRARTRIRRELARRGWLAGGGS